MVKNYEITDPKAGHEDTKRLRNLKNEANVKGKGAKRGLRQLQAEAEQKSTATLDAQKLGASLGQKLLAEVVELREEIKEDQMKVDE